MRDKGNGQKTARRCKAAKESRSPEQPLTSTLEDYLLAIHRIVLAQKVARPKDIVEAQNVASSTVTAALQGLAEKELIHYEPYELITLTDRGLEKAERLATRHLIVRHFLEDVLGLEAQHAKTTAGAMEHAVDRSALRRLVCFMAFLRRHPPSKTSWLDAFRAFLEKGSNGRSCSECVKEYLANMETPAGHWPALE